MTALGRESRGPGGMCVDGLCERSRDRGTGRGRRRPHRGRWCGGRWRGRLERSRRRRTCDLRSGRRRRRGGGSGGPLALRLDLGAYRRIQGEGQGVIVEAQRQVGSAQALEVPRIPPPAFDLHRSAGHSGCRAGLPIQRLQGLGPPVLQPLVDAREREHLNAAREHDPRHGDVGGLRRVGLPSAPDLASQQLAEERAEMDDGIALRLGRLPRLLVGGCAFDPPRLVEEVVEGDDGRRVKLEGHERPHRRDGLLRKRRVVRPGGSGPSLGVRSVAERALHELPVVGAPAGGTPDRLRHALPLAIGPSRRSARPKRRGAAAQREYTLAPRLREERRRRRAHGGDPSIKLSADGPRGLQEEARLLQDSRAARRGASRRRLVVLHPEARGLAPPLRLPAGAGRSAPELGRAEGPVLRPARQATRDARRGPSGRVRLLRGRDPREGIRSGNGRPLGPRDVDARDRSEARPQEGGAEVRAPGREARREVGPRQDQGGRPQGLAARQGPGRARAAGGGAGHRERASGERGLRARPRRGGGGAGPPLALQGGPGRGRGGSGRPRGGRRRARASALPTSRAPCAARCPGASPWPWPWSSRSRRKATSGSTRSSTTGTASWRGSKRARSGSSPETRRTGPRSSPRSPGPSPGFPREPRSSTERWPRCCRAGQRASTPSSVARRERRRSSTSPSTSCTSTGGTSVG